MESGSQFSHYGMGYWQRAWSQASTSVVMAWVIDSMLKKIALSVFTMTEMIEKNCTVYIYLDRDDRDALYRAFSEG